MNQADMLRALNFLRLDVSDYGRIAAVKGQYYYENNPYYQKELSMNSPFDYFQVTLSGGMHPDYVDERNEDRFYEYKITMQDSIKRACETQIGPCSVMMNDSGGFDVAFNKMLRESMKITRRQLRVLINETIFAGGPTFFRPGESEGVTVDMGRQKSPKFNKRSKLDQAIRDADPRLKALIDSGDEAQIEQARMLAGQLFDIPEEIELSPEEEEAQSLYDKFDGLEMPGRLVSPRRYRSYNTPDERLQRSYAPEIQQIKDHMKRRIEAAMANGETDYDDLYDTADSTPGFHNLSRAIEKKPVGEKQGMTGLEDFNDPWFDLSYLVTSVLDELGIEQEPYY